MKRLISLGLITAFLCASTTPLMAQRGRTATPSKTKATASETRFADVRAYSDGNGVLVEWNMAAEKNSGGFYVRRIDDGVEVQASDELIDGAGLSLSSKTETGEKYKFYDPNGTSSSTYYIQNVGLDGKAITSNSVTVESVDGLESVGFESSETLAREAADKKLKGILRGESLKLPKTLAKEVSDNQSFADANTHAWVIAQPGARIGVRRDGFYRVTKAELQAAGFNVNGDPNLWQLYRQGVEQSIIVGPNGDYIEFYGRAVDTVETDLAIYFLVSGPAAGKRIATKVARPISGTVTSANYAVATEIRERTGYRNQILNGEAGNIWGGAATNLGESTFNFTLTGVDSSVAESTFEVRFQGFNFGPHSIQVKLNGQTLAPATGTDQIPFAKQYTVPTSFLNEGNNALVMKAVGSSNDFCFFDSITVGYKRKQKAEQNRLKFYTDNYRLSKLEGFSSSNIRVFDMTAEAAPVLWTNLDPFQDGATYSVRMPADRGRSMFAVEDSAVMAAALVGPNDPASLKATSNAGQLVIITYKDWATQAQNWANYRIGQGFSAKVVDVNEVFDEFNFGDSSSVAIKNFLQYAKNNWQTPPSYVLLLGDASFDGRKYLSDSGYYNFVPTHMVDTVFIETGSDDYMTDFNGDGLAEIPIGRITARDGQTVTNVLAKVMNWEQTLPTPQSRGVIFAYDCFDATNNYDFEQISVNLRNQLPGGITSTMAGRCDSTTPPATPTSVLIDAINGGKYMVNYAGHGATGSWQGGFFVNSNVAQLTNSGNLSIFTMLTCFNGYFMINNTNKSLAENLVESTNGGAVAAWASTGETTPDVQEIMATRFFNRVGQGNIIRLGDLVNDAKSVIPGGTDVRLSWALIGDPVLKVRNPSGGDRPEKQRR